MRHASSIYKWCFKLEGGADYKQVLYSSAQSYSHIYKVGKPASKENKSYFHQNLSEIV